MRRAGTLGARALRSVAIAVLVPAALALTGPGTHGAAHAAGPPAFDARELANADGWAAQPPSRDRDRILRRWASSATLHELAFVLRRSSAELGPVESELVERAWEITPASRTALRRGWIARLAAIQPSRARRRAAHVVDALREPPLGPRASVFRVAALAPASGAYEDFAQAMRAGLEAGVTRGADGELAIEVRAWDTGSQDPARAAAALDSAVRGSALLVGELLSATTVALATGARIARTPLVSPTATDEAIGAVGPGVFAIGPSAWERGVRLARALELRGKRVGILTSSATSPAFADGFAAAAREAGATIPWEASYSAGNTAFRGESRTIGVRKLDLLFWDGEAAEVQALLRQLGRDRVAVGVCGGSALAPELSHGDARFLLEGVTYVGDEWTLPAAERAWLDAWARERSNEPAGPLHVRGFLAGRLARDAVRSGALCAEEIAAWLATRRKTDPHLRDHGFVEFGVAGTELPVHVVRRGKGVALAP